MDEKATNFLGVPITLQVFSPTLSDPISRPVTSTVSLTGVEFPAIEVVGINGGNIVDVAFDLTETRISFVVEEPDSFFGGRFSTAGFNGYVFTDTNDRLADIVGFRVPGETNTLGLTPGRVSFNAEQIAINVSGLSYSQGQTFDVIVTFAEPADPDDSEEEGTDGDDVFDPGPGFDIIIGRGGSDTVNLRALDGAATDLFAIGNQTYFIDAADRSFDRYVDIEQVSADGRTVSVSDLDGFDPLDYLAANVDLVATLGIDADAALDHYLRTGFIEGRDAEFDAAQYLENWADLQAAFGNDESAARLHYITNGAGEGRLADDPLAYVASYADLSAAFGAADPATVAALGLAHFAVAGSSEGRDVTFDAAQYLENWDDLRGAFGDNEDAAALHYIQFGRNEGRLATNPLDYIASNDDLIAAFRGLADRGVDAIGDAGLLHYAVAGAGEGRRTEEFDVSSYLSNYADIRAAVPGPDASYDTDLATAHYIVNGFGEGRTDDLVLI